MSDSLRFLVIPYGTFLFKYRNAVFPLFLVVLLVAFTPGHPLGHHREFWLDALGLLVAGVGQGLHVVVLGWATIKRGGVNKHLHANGLLTEGAFAHCRNPLYLGNLFILCGLFILYNNRWVYVLGSLFFLAAYGAIVAAEEAFLGEKYGTDYEAYCHRVNRWWPSLRGVGRTITSRPFSWRRIIAKDYASAYNWMAVAILLLADKSWRWSPSRALTPYLIGLSILTTGCLLARYLKKSGHLGFTTE